MKLSNIQIILGEGETLGQLVCIVDLLIDSEESAASHPDNLIKSFVTNIEVLKIHSVELVAFGKVGIDVTKIYTKDKDLNTRLESEIISEVEYKNLNELKSAA
jgi:hypothetical protein